MEGDWHFSHDHPLTSFVVNDKEVDESDNFHSCKICGLPILSAPSYTCTFVACDFFLHESCAHKFHQKFIHPNHWPSYKYHTLRLEEGSPNFTYQCEDCNFEMHPLSAVDGVEIKTKHKSHSPHPLMAHCRKSLSMCDGCGGEHDGFFFSCQLCNFWIHQNCTILPTALKLFSNPEPYLLAYSIPTHIRTIECIVCHQPLLLSHNAIYFCPPTLRFSHVRCGLENIQSKTRLKLIQLPDDELGTFPSLEFRALSQPEEGPSGEDAKLAIENFHKQPLILVGEDDEDHDYKKLVCDICIQTIAIPSQFYKCSQQTGGCSFLAHKVCVELLPLLNFGIPDDVTSDVLKAQPCPRPNLWFFSSIYFCFFCSLPCNGPCYFFSESEHPLYDVPLMMDLSCMAAPSIIKHNSHSQHLLFRTGRHSRASSISCCSRGSTILDVYRCITCDFYIHIRCALLPKRVHFHIFDQHPLHLITTGTTDHDICEVCEEGIECKYWFYRCAKCDYSFHINCIPSLGYLSKIKFGGKSSMPCHSHPITLKRMLTYGRNERCGYCHQIIPGLVDQAAFSCSQCDYWIHFSCARDSLSSTYHIPRSMVFGEYDVQVIYDFISCQSE
ncbi:uncharacterized protein LOC121779605 [Salvia splendens]|nr:uncharacterized protein LOC121779605 [Salvia splendens]XP_042032882.1 uncharacterized protein LOC121779605 [Salvia splendens]